MRREVTLVGAGLVGCLWAVLLRQRGYPVRVFEKRPDLRKAGAGGGRSINLVITSRGLHGLEEAGLAAPALALSTPVYGRMIHPKEGETRFQPYGRENECNFSVSRSRLNEFLLNEAASAGAELHFDSALEQVDFAARQLTFRDGRTVSYDLLFGADGAGSVVRRQLCRRFPEEFRESVEWLEADYKEMVLPAGPGGAYRLEKNALHIWPRGSHMLMALPNLDGSFTLTLYLPRQGADASFERLRSREDVERVFQSEFRSALQQVPDLVDQFLAHPQGELGTVRCSRWVHADSVALLGDAAHAIVPFFGQGMNAGFEDCTTLLSLLGSHGDAWAAALREYDAVQRPNANAIADMALENWTEMRDRVGDARFLLRKQVESLLERELPELYRSRYGMITYTLIPYLKAQEAGKIQDRILARLCEGIRSPEEVSLTESRRLLEEELRPFLERNRIRLGRYLPRTPVIPARTPP
jgi:kynurenine 3-monooxygenase